MIRSGVRRAGAVVGVLGLVIVSVTSTGSAAEGWKKPVSLGKIVTYVDLTSSSVGTRGDIATGWNWKETTAPFAYHVQVATSRRGHSWAKPVSFYAGNQGDVDGPHVVVDGHGLVTALWAQGAHGTNPDRCAVHVASGKPGATWSQPQTLSTQCALSTQLTVDGDGDLVAAWQSQDTRRPTCATKMHGRRWSAPAAVPSAKKLKVQGMATTSAGDSTMVLTGAGRPKRGVYVVQRHRRSAWSKPVRVSRVKARDVPTVAESAQGDVTVMWSGSGRRVLTASRPAQGRWTTARRLGRGVAAHVEYYKREVLAVWVSPRGSTMFAAKPSNARWTSATTLSGTSKRNEGQALGVDRRGRVTVAWSNFFTGDISARARSKNGRWSAIQTVTAKGYGASPFVDSSSKGRAWIAWRNRSHFNMNDHKFQVKASLAD